MLERVRTAATLLRHPIRTCKVVLTVAVAAADDTYWWRNWKVDTQVCEDCEGAICDYHLAQAQRRLKDHYGSVPEVIK